MANWARRMHRRAQTIGTVVTSCGHPPPHPFPRRLEKVKFGVPLDQVCKPDIPGPLLVLILKLNKEAPQKKDIFRAPGHQGNMKKLIHFLQNGRLVNIDNFSVYTIASVLKKFLRKLPGGIFGADGEARLFSVIDSDNPDEIFSEIHDLITTTMPVSAQRLLALLFGTFRVIATTAERVQTGMTSEALGVSVAPSFFHSCVSNGKQAKMEDVLRFKTATRIMKYLIDSFGVTNLFGRDNYEYYSRITGRILKVDDEWIYAFRYPPETTASREEILEAQERLLQREADIWGLTYTLGVISKQEESQSTPALIHVPEGGTEAAEAEPSTSGVGRMATVPENSLRESHTRLSVSLEESELFKGTSSSSSSSSSSSAAAAAASSSSSSAASRHRLTLEELKAINRYAESTKSLSYLPQVHERQTARMRTRSEWFLAAQVPSSRVFVVPIELEDTRSKTEPGGNNQHSNHHNNHNNRHHRSSSGRSSCVGGGEHCGKPVRRTSSKEKKLLRRSSSKSKKDKENGNNSVSIEALHGIEKSVGTGGGGGPGLGGGGGGGSPRRGSVPSGILLLTQQQQQQQQSPSRVPTTTRSVPELEYHLMESSASTADKEKQFVVAYKPRI